MLLSADVYDSMMLELVRCSKPFLHAVLKKDDTSAEAIVLLAHAAEHLTRRHSLTRSLTRHCRAQNPN